MQLIKENPVILQKYHNGKNRYILYKIKRKEILASNYSPRNCLIPDEVLFPFILYKRFLSIAISSPGCLGD